MLGHISKEEGYKMLGHISKEESYKMLGHISKEESYKMLGHIRRGARGLKLDSDDLWFPPSKPHYN